MIGTNTRNLLQRLREVNSDFRVLHSKVDLKILSELDFYSEPRKSRSAGSKAVYLAEKNDGERSLLLQYMPADSITSKHYHKITIEIFHNLGGTCIVYRNGKELVLQGRSIEIFPREIHQVKTRDSGALTLIEMIGNPNGLSMDDHFYVS